MGWGGEVAREGGGMCVGRRVVAGASGSTRGAVRAPGGRARAWNRGEKVGKGEKQSNKNDARI